MEEKRKGFASAVSNRAMLHKFQSKLEYSATGDDDFVHYWFSERYVPTMILPINGVHTFNRLYLQATYVIQSGTLSDDLNKHRIGGVLYHL